MNLLGKLGVAAALLSAPLISSAAACTSQAEMTAQERDLISGVSLRLAAAAQQQDYVSLQRDLLPSEASEWNSIQAAAQNAATLIAGGQIKLRNLYLLDASMQAATADAQFFCTNASGSLTVTITMRQLPPGRYAVVLAEAAGAKLAGQLGLVLAWDASAPGWRLAGLSAHQGEFDGHDGVWYWTRGRSLAQGDPWSAWYSYDAARYLLIPVDFLVSPNLQKLNQEQSEIEPSPVKEFPLNLLQGDRTWKVDSVYLDPSLQQADLAVVYESTGVTDPAALRTEATSVLSALLKAQPGLRNNFNGLWAIAVKDGKRNPVMELPMNQIP